MQVRRQIGPVRHPRRRAGRTRLLPGGIASLLLALALAASATLALVLARGPVDLAAAVPRLEAMANAGLGEAAGGLRLTLGGARLGLGPAGAPAPGLYLEDVHLIDGDGTTVVVAPNVRVGFRPLDLLAGQVRLTRITVLGASLSLRQPADGPLTGDIDPPAPEGASPPALAALLSRLAAAPPPLLSALRQVDFEQTTVAVALAEPAARAVFERVAVRFRLDEGRLSGRALVPVPGLGQPVSVEALLLPEGGVRVAATLPPVLLSDLAGMVSGLAGVAVPVAGEVAATLGPDGRLDAASARLSAGPGRVAVAGRQVALDAAALHLRHDPGNGDGGHAVDVAGLSLSAGPVAVEATGRVVVSDAGGVPGEATVALSLGRVTLPLDPGAAAGPLARFGQGVLVARVRRDPWRIEIADAALSRGALHLGLSGSVAQVGDGAGQDWSLALGGSVRGLAVPDLLALWPRPVASGALAWMREHLEGGTVDAAHVSVGGTVAAPRAALDFAFHDARATPLPPLPPVTGARGVGRVEMDAFTLALEAGRVAVPGAAGGEIDLAGSTFRLSPLDAPDTPAEISVRGQGPVQAMLSLIAAPPLSLLDRVAIDPAQVGGQASVVADLRVPLRQDLRLEAVGVAVSATLRDAAMDLGAPLGRFAAPRLDLTADTESLRLAGAGQVARSGVGVVWDEVFGPPAQTPRTTLVLDVGLDPADAARLGLNADAVAPAAALRLTGAVPVRAELRRDGGGVPAGATAFAVSADLRRAAFAVPALGVDKPAGAAARAAAAGVVGAGGGVTLDGLSLDAADLRLRARVDVDRARRVQRLDVESLRIGEDTDLAAVAVRSADGFDVTLRGRSFDATDVRAMLASGEEASTTGRPLAVRLVLDRLVLTPDLAVTQARGELRRAGDGALDVGFSATGPRDAPLSLDFDRDAGGVGRLRLTSRNAGALAREAGQFSRAFGGQLDLSARLLAGGVVEGEALVDDVVVSDDPRLDRLLAGADLDRALAQLRAEGIRFETVRAPFRWQGDTVTLIDAVAYGPTIGLTLTGSYARRADALSMTGVFTPLYGINSLLGDLPVLGPLLTGGEGQGLLGITFALEGSAADPDITINPFSAFLPGPLRQLVQPRVEPEPDGWVDPR